MRGHKLHAYLILALDVPGHLAGQINEVWRQNHYQQLITESSEYHLGNLMTTLDIDVAELFRFGSNHQNANSQGRENSGSFISKYGFFYFVDCTACCTPTVTGLQSELIWVSLQDTESQLHHTSRIYLRGYACYTFNTRGEAVDRFVELVKASS